MTPCTYNQGAILRFMINATSLFTAATVLKKLKSIILQNVCFIKFVLTSWEVVAPDTSITESVCGRSDEREWRQGQKYRGRQRREVEKKSEKTKIELQNIYVCIIRTFYY